MLSFLEIASILITAGLAVFAVTTDFRDSETKKIKPAGKLYITIFLFSVGLSYLFSQLSNNQKKAEANKNFNNTILNIRDSTEKLLKQTKDSLDNQFNRINRLSQRIDSNLALTSISMQTQFKQAKKNQEIINQLAEKTITDLGYAINSIQEIDEQQKKSISELTDITVLTSQNLSAIDKVFSEINSLAEPIIPIQLVFRIKYELLNPSYELPDQAQVWGGEIRGVNDIREIVNKFSKYNSELTGPKKIVKDFFSPGTFDIRFYKDSTSLEIIDFCGEIEEEKLKYVFKCQKKWESSLFFDESDNSVVREYVLTFTEVFSNDYQIKSIKDLLDKSQIHLFFSHENNEKLRYKFEVSYFDSKFKWNVFKVRAGIKNFKIVPYCVIRYGEKFKFNKSIEPKKMEILDFGIETSELIVFPNVHHTKLPSTHNMPKIKN